MFVGKKTSLHDYGMVSPLDLVSETTISTLTTLHLVGEDDDTRFEHAIRLPIEIPSRFKHRGGVTGFFFRTLCTMESVTCRSTVTVTHDSVLVVGTITLWDSNKAHV